MNVFRKRKIFLVADNRSGQAAPHKQAANQLQSQKKKCMYN